MVEILTSIPRLAVQSMYTSLVQRHLLHPLRSRQHKTFYTQALGISAYGPGALRPVARERDSSREVIQTLLNAYFA